MKLIESNKAIASDSLAGIYVRILEALCGAADFRAAAKTVLKEISHATNCEAVGLRVHDRKDDFPYFSYLGFDDSFIEQENRLCRMECDGRIAREATGHSTLDCMCGVVLRGRTDAGKSIFTEGGSFWTNSTTELLSGQGTSKLEPGTRNTCNTAGYESVALVPLRCEDRILGLLQVNSREARRFTPDLIEFLEMIGHHTGAAVEAAWRREHLGLMLKEFEAQQSGPAAAVAMEQMAATLAHEVKNPLAGMMLSATRLRKFLKGDDKVGSIADHLIHSINTLSETVTRVTDSAGRPQVEMDRLEINQVLEGALHLIAPRAADQDVLIIRQMPENLPAIQADAHLLKRAFLNLLVNALEAMPASGRLSVETRQTDDGGIQTTITDTGSGLDDDQVETLFKPFVTGKPNGTGLGLAIVKRIAELHSGSVDLRATPGGGAQAILRLPAAEV